MTESNQVEALERVLRGAIESGTKADTPFVIVPQGYKVEGVEPFQSRPYRLKASPDFDTVASFIDYVNRWKEADVSTIFCNVTGRKLDAVLDDHATPGVASWRTHKATYEAELSRELLFWQGRNKTDLTQVQFAELLEERMVDVETPSGAALLELALNLQTKTEVAFRSAVRLNSGMVRMEYSEETGNGNVDLPNQIGLAIPLFHNGDLYKVLARLRFRVKDSKATFRYQLVDIEDKLEHAFKAIVTRVTQETSGVAIYQGTR